MCGIAGIVSRAGRPVEASWLEAMAGTVAHRGPDGERFLVIRAGRKEAALFHRREPRPDSADIGFAHRRLSIIDLSASAAQPMSDASGDVWIVYNGEIFNYLEIREELQGLGRRFHTQSDTEVILNAYLEWGKDCLSRFNGMWAFVIYDFRTGRLFGARDRFGIKPFYCHVSPSFFSFASEIKALLALPWVERKPHLPAIKDYLFYSRVDTSASTFFEGIRALEPGHFFEIGFAPEFRISFTRWWKLEENLQPVLLSPSEIDERFRDLLLSSVRLRLRSDVPLGTCLSGGLDSSAIVALAHPYLAEGRQKTFSIVHPGFAFDESRYVDAVAGNFGLTPYKTTTSGGGLLQDLDQVIESHDEPFTSTSMYAQWKVFQLAKRCGVTVTLDGQGADELLAGYPYFKMVYGAELLQRLRWGRFMKETGAPGSPLPGRLAAAVTALAGFLPHRRMIALAGMRAAQYVQDWIAKDFFRGVELPHPPVEIKFRSRLNQRLYEVFSQDGLPALLRYGDRNSMRHGVESRVPFLDYRLVSYVFSLPPEYKIRDGLSKAVLRRALKKDIPPLVLERRDKIGFVTPEAGWFRTEMKERMREVFESPSLPLRGFYRARELRRLFARHMSGAADASRPLWRVFNLELWMRRYLD